MEAVAKGVGKGRGLSCAPRHSADSPGPDGGRGGSLAGGGMGVLGHLASAIQSLVVDHAAYSWTARWDLTKAAGVVAVVVIVILLTPRSSSRRVLIAAIFAMPVLVSHVARRDYPQLEGAGAATVLGSAWNAFVAIGLPWCCGWSRSPSGCWVRSARCCRCCCLRT